MTKDEILTVARKHDPDAEWASDDADENCLLVLPAGGRPAIERFRSYPVNPAYEMTTVTLTVPLLANDGTNRLYRFQMRGGLLENGITGWTEVESVGFWKGKKEPGVIFLFYVLPEEVEAVTQLIGSLARTIMPDQEAIQITVSRAPVRLIEA